MLITTLAAGAAAAVVAADRPTSPTEAQPTITTDRVVPAAVDLGQLQYQIVTRSGGDPDSCQAATARVSTATIGVPARTSR
jgi:hypothetical protein